jgi:prepilin peptidase CpaA
VKLFFPDSAFAWAFCVGLVLLTAVAAWTDTRKAKIPNWLTVLILALGLAANAARGGWLASENKPLWVFDTGAVWLGVLDGLLFALTGFLVAFAAMFVIWIFGACGGGDVKLLGAVGAWVGFAYFPLVWLASVVVLFVWLGARLLTGGLSPRQVRKSINELHKQKRDRDAGRAPATKPGKLRATYSLPLVVALAAVLMWLFRYELQLKPRPADPHGAIAHVRPPPPGA